MARLDLTPGTSLRGENLVTRAAIPVGLSTSVSVIVSPALGHFPTDHRHRADHTAIISGSSGMPVISSGPLSVITTVRPIIRPVSSFHPGS